MIATENDVIISNSLDELYQKAIRRVLLFGSMVTARGLTFREARFQHLILKNPRSRIVNNSVRKISKRFLAAEFISIMTSNPWLDMISFYNKNMKDYSDDGISLHGAYGPRLRHWGQPGADFDQLKDCLRRLKEDLYTRQASIVILDPAKDFTVKTKDVPCNNYLQFMYRDGALDLLCYVRSNDMFLGFPYDVAEWCMLQEIFATELKVNLGNYHHVVGSFHIYEKDIEKMKGIAFLDLAPEWLTPMLQMPPETSLATLDELKKVEEKYRKTGVIQSKILPEWWMEFASWLKK